VVGVVLGVAGLVGAGCSSNSESSGGGSASATTAAGATSAAGDNEVKLTAENTAWSTTSMQFISGAKVTVEVTNKDGVEHNFTFKEATAAKDIEGGDDATVSFTAPAAGSYKFFCKYHPSAMTGTVTIT